LKVKFFRQKKGVATIYASLLALILILMLLMLVISFFVNYNSITKSQTAITDQKIREKLSINNVVPETNKLNIVVENTGSIELIVRAIYIKNNGSVSFVRDPSVYMKPATLATIPIPLPTVQNFSIVAATERGTLSSEFFIPTWALNTYRYDTENLTIGALRLKFESFELSIYDSTKNQWGSWIPGWNPPTGPYLKWRVNITNISEGPVMLNNRTSLGISLVDGPTEVLWYINPISVSLPVNQTVPVIYAVNQPEGIPTKDLQKITVGEGTPYMVFLTFFGTSQDALGVIQPYGQNIPFEAIIPGG
jgi:hypothetical protein